MPMSFFVRCARSIGLILFAAATATADEATAPAANAAVKETPSLEREQTARLIEQLGASSFDKRETATRQIKEIGTPALAALRQASTHRNLEIRYRARRLLIDVENLEHERRLAAFEKNPEAADDDLLPGLKRFRETVGSDANSLLFFVEMQRSVRSLFQHSQHPGTAFDNLFDLRISELQIECNLRQRMHKVPERLSSLLFLGSDPRHAERDTSSSTIYSLIHVAEFNKVMTGSTAETPAVRKVLGLWIGRPGGGIVYQRLMLAMTFGFREGLEPAVDVLKRPGAAFQTQYALLAVGRFGSREQLPLVEKYFNDKTVLTTTAVNSRTTYSSQVRDVALAVATHLAEQDVSKYGFKSIQRHNQYLFSPNTLGFGSDGDRESAFSKWNDWKASQQTEPATAEIPQR